MFGESSLYLGAFPFAQRPPANSCLSCSFNATDLNFAEFISDGTNWRPRGYQDIYHKNGLLSAPLATLTGVTSGLFAITDCKIPAGLLLPNSKLSVQIAARKTTGVATAFFNIVLGTAKTLSDRTLAGLTSTATANADAAMACSARVASNTALISQSGLGDGSMTAGGSGALNEVSGGNFNTALDMYVSIGISSANTSDNFSLVSMRVSCEA
jgi:hypothetical protein